MVSRDEIIDAVWDGRFIAETTLTRAIADLRRALGDSRLEDAQGLEGLRVWFDLIYLQRYNPHLRPFFEWVGFGTTFAQTASAVDHGAILDMVERHEGSLSAAIARHWLERQPDAFLTVRSVTAELIGFVCHLRLEAVTPEDVAVDPAVANAIAHMERHGPPGAGEHTVYPGSGRIATDIRPRCWRRSRQAVRRTGPRLGSPGASSRSLIRT